MERDRRHNEIGVQHHVRLGLAKHPAHQEAEGSPSDARDVPTERARGVDSARSRGKSKQGKFVWLSNFDIDAVLKQYTSLEEFKDFKFFNSAPIDFEKIDDPLSRVNPVLFKRKGINRIAAVINLDTHDQPGSHWVSMVANFKTGVIAYFDSYSSLPEPEIQDFMAKLVVQAMTGFDGKSFNSKEAFFLCPLYNNTRFQRKSSECGQYSLYTVISFLLSDGTAEDFAGICSVPIDDDSMNDFRRALFVDSGFQSPDKLH